MIWMPTRQKPAEWDLHLRSNAFGLLIGDDPSPSNSPMSWESFVEEMAEPLWMWGQGDWSSG